MIALSEIDRQMARACLRHMRCTLPAHADGRFSCLCRALCWPQLSNRSPHRDGAQDAPAEAVKP